MIENKVAKKKVGRPKKLYEMTNGTVTAENLYIFTPQNTIPNRETNRFLELCDMMIGEMFSEELTPSDIDAVAQYNKLRMFGDKICKDMAEQDITDMGFIAQLEKLDKQQQNKLENLKLRRKDRHLGKTDGRGKSLTELARELDDKNNDRIQNFKKKNETELDKFQTEFEDADPSVFIENMSNRNKP